MLTNMVTILNNHCKVSGICHISRQIYFEDPRWSGKIWPPSQFFNLERKITWYSNPVVLGQFKWDVFDHSVHSPNLEQSDFLSLP